MMKLHSPGSKGIDTSAFLGSRNLETDSSKNVVEGGLLVQANTRNVPTPTATKSAGYTLLLNDHSISVTAVATIVLADPMTVEGQEYIIVHDIAAGGTITITGTINGTSAHTLTTRYEFLRIKSINGLYYKC